MENYRKMKRKIEELKYRFESMTYMVGLFCYNNLPFALWLMFLVGMMVGATVNVIFAK